MHACANCGAEIDDSQTYCDEECESEFHNEYLNEPLELDDEEDW